MTHDIPETAVSVLPEPLPAEITVVDVREQAEWVTGHIEGALHIPLMQLVERLSEIPPDGSVLVVCRVGSRSAHATAFLNAQGHAAQNLAGGMVEWEAARRPMVSETDAAPFVY